MRIARDGSRKCSFFNQPDEGKQVLGCDQQHHASWTVLPERQPNLFFSTQVAQTIAEADVVLIAVNTPTKTRGAGAGSATDMTAFEAVTSEVAQHARPGTIIVEKSTVPCRTADLVRRTVRYSLSTVDLIFVG